MAGYVCEMCTYSVYIHDVNAEHIKYVYVCAHAFGRGQRVWAFAMLSQQGARATLEGTDGLNSVSPWFYNSGRQREEQRARETERYRGRFNH